jgi:hypothetical protein
MLHIIDVNLLEDYILTEATHVIRIRGNFAYLRRVFSLKKPGRIYYRGFQGKTIRLAKDLDIPSLKEQKS